MRQAQLSFLFSEAIARSLRVSAAVLALFHVVSAPAHAAGTFYASPSGPPTTGYPWTVQNFETLYYYPQSTTTGERRLRARAQSANSPAVGYYMSGGSCHSSQAGGAVVSASFCNLGTYLRIASPIFVGNSS